jgi:hypothetical protein
VITLLAVVAVALAVTTGYSIQRITQITTKCHHPAEIDPITVLADIGIEQIETYLRQEAEK